MEPMVFLYSFTIKGYDVTVTIEFFSHIIVLEDSSLESTNDELEDVDIFLNLWISNGWRFILLCFILQLRYFTAEIFYCLVIYLLQYAFYYAHMSAIGSVSGLSHNPCQSHPRPKVKKRANSSKTSLIAFGPCFKPIVKFQFRFPTQHKSHLSEGKLFRPDIRIKSSCK